MMTCICFRQFKLSNCEDIEGGNCCDHRIMDAIVLSLLILVIFVRMQNVIVLMIVMQVEFNVILKVFIEMLALITVMLVMLVGMVVVIMVLLMLLVV